MRLLSRIRHDERGELSIAAWLVIAVLVAVGPAVLVSLSYLFSDEYGSRGGGGSTGVDDTIFVSAPRCREANELAQREFGLVYTARGWRLTDEPAPVYEGDQRAFNMAFASYRGTVLAKLDGATDALERECRRQEPLGDTTTIVTEPPRAQPDIPGTYTYEPDTSGQAGECAAVIHPRELTVTLSGTDLAVTAVTPDLVAVYRGSLGPDYTFDLVATFESGDFAGTEIGRIRGRFDVFNGVTIIREGIRDIEIGGGCRFGYAATKKTS